MPAATKDVLLSGYTPIIVTYPKSLRATILCYKYSSSYRFDQLTEILAVDFPGKEARFVLFYGFLNINFNNRL